MLMIEKKGIVEQIDSIAHNDKVDKFKAAKFAVENARAIEAEPVRHGRWIEQESPYGGHFNCSECGHEVTVPHSELIDPRDYVCYLDDYCGKCGTRMDGGAENG